MQVPLPSSATLASSLWVPLPFRLPGSTSYALTLPEGAVLDSAGVGVASATVASVRTSRDLSGPVPQVGGLVAPARPTCLHSPCTCHMPSPAHHEFTHPPSTLAVQGMAATTTTLAHQQPEVVIALDEASPTAGRGTLQWLSSLHSSSASFNMSLVAADEDPSTVAQAGVLPLDRGRYRVVGRTLHARPLYDLVAGDRYTLTYASDALRDSSGNPYEGGATQTFDIPAGIDHSPPFIASSEPAPGNSSVPVDAAVTLRFSEPVHSVNASAFRLWALHPPREIPTAAAALHNGGAVSLQPLMPLPSATAFTVEVPTCIANIHACAHRPGAHTRLTS